MLSEQRGYAVKFGFAAVVLVAAWAGLFATTASAAPVPVASLNAESMTLPRGAAAVRDRNADGARAVEFDRNGVATASLTTASAVTSLTLSARGTQCRSTWPQVQLAIDGAVVLNVAANKTAWTAFAATGLSIPAGTHSIVAHPEQRAGLQMRPRGVHRHPPAVRRLRSAAARSAATTASATATATAASAAATASAATATAASATAASATAASATAATATSATAPADFELPEHHHPGLLLSQPDAALG